MPVKMKLDALKKHLAKFDLTDYKRNQMRPMKDVRLTDPVIEAANQAVERQRKAKGKGQKKGVRVLTLPKRSELPADRDIRPEGTVLFEGNYWGRAVPWKAFVRASKTGKHAKAREDYAHLGQYKADVRRQLGLRFGGRLPYAGPVALYVTFYLHRTDGTAPDSTNLLKAFEDAIQGVLIVNDSQVDRSFPFRRIDADVFERVEFKIVAT